MDLLDPFDATSPYCLSGKVSSRSDYIEIAAGNSDIWTGFIDGQKVAIKVLRYAFGKDMSANDIQKVRRVCTIFVTLHSSQITSSPEIVERIYHLVFPITPEHRSIPWFHP